MRFPSVSQKRAIKAAVGQVSDRVITQALDRFANYQDLTLTTRLLDLEHQQTLGENVSKDIQDIKIVLACRSV